MADPRSLKRQMESLRRYAIQFGMRDADEWLVTHFFKGEVDQSSNEIRAEFLYVKKSGGES